jgi:hypothetical protein
VELAEHVADVSQVRLLLLGDVAGADDQGRLVVISPEFGENVTIRLKIPMPQSLHDGSSIPLDDGAQIAFPVGICSPVKDASVFVRLAGTTPVQEKVRLPWALRVGDDDLRREWCCHR